MSLSISLYLSLSFSHIISKSAVKNKIKNWKDLERHQYKNEQIIEGAKESDDDVDVDVEYMVSSLLC